MEVERVRQGLSKALMLQYRMTIAYTVAAGGIAGLELRGIAHDLAAFAAAELEETKVLVEKLTALGGTPPATTSLPVWANDNVALLESIVRHEQELIETLHAIIPATGQEGRSEALEHLLEHAIMRKQRQVDLLARSIGKESI